MILAQWQSCDGYKLRCQLSNSEVLTFTLPELPTDIEAAAAALEQSHLDYLAAEAEQVIELEIVPE